MQSKTAEKQNRSDPPLKQKIHLQYNGISLCITPMQPASEWDVPGTVSGVFVLGCAPCARSQALPGAFGVGSGVSIETQ